MALLNGEHRLAEEQPTWVVQPTVLSSERERLARRPRNVECDRALGDVPVENVVSDAQVRDTVVAVNERARNRPVVTRPGLGKAQARPLSEDNDRHVHSAEVGGKDK